jgi:hypothetical protein|tara:strand:+ start:244 stop:588 length:345 start_codon:yes stop_codon:yes gene_type:complete
MKLTKTRLAELIKQQCDLQSSTEKTIKIMFRNFKHEDTHFQLNYKGYHLMKYAKFKWYKIKITSKLTMKALLNLDRHCPAPYYINGKRTYVFMFSEQPAVMLQLLDGDLKNFQL